MTVVTLHVGTYAEAGGRGLQQAEYDTEAGFTLVDHDPSAANASFGAWSATHDLHYLVDERSKGQLGIYRRAASEWQMLSALPSEGREPCYVALSPDERRVAVANYASGSITLVGLTPDGLPDGRVAVWANDGSGPHRERQEAPHMHCVRFSPDGRALFAVDLGTDQLLRFIIDDASMLDMPELAWTAPPGSGPRHLVFHLTHSLALLVSELDSTLTLFDASGGRLRPLDRVKTVPESDLDGNLGGHVELNRAGTRIYVTNRGHDSIAVFSLDPTAASMTPLQHVASGGESPRFFLMLDRIARLIVVNEMAGNLVAFRVDADGRLQPTGHMIDVAGAAFVFATRT